MSTNQRIEVKVSPVDFTFKFLFFATLASGVISIFFNNWWISPLCITLYFLAGVIISRNYKVTEAFADSLYYLGFLFTLWALFVSLGPMISDLTKMTSGFIINQFGIALITTVLGITYRTLIVQAQHRFFGAPNTIEESFSELASSLEQEKNIYVHSIKQLRKDLLHESYNVIKELSAVTTRNIEVARKDGENAKLIILEAKTTAQQAAAEINTLTTDAEKKLEEAKNALEEKFNEKWAGLTIKMEDTIKKESEYQQSLESIVSTLNDINKGLRQAANSIGAQSGQMATAELKKIADHFDKPLWRRIL